jgi:hypothetical protein
LVISSLLLSLFSIVTFAVASPREIEILAITNDNGNSTNLTFSSSIANTSGVNYVITASSGQSLQTHNVSLEKLSNSNKVKVSEAELAQIKKLGKKLAIKIADSNKDSVNKGAVASFAEGVRLVYGEDNKDSNSYNNGVKKYFTEKIPSLKPGVQYKFTVVATDAGRRVFKSTEFDYVVNSIIPEMPLITKVEATDADEAVIWFDSPSFNGGSPIYNYIAISNPGSITANSPQQGSGSITVVGLTKATNYTFKVSAQNINGTSKSSASSAPITTLAEKIVRRTPTSNAPTLAAPAFALSLSSQSVLVNTAITTVTNTSTGGAIASYAISPAAPSGLTFSTTTGQLSGTPTASQSATTYTITATNASGSATQSFALTVTAVVYTVGQRGPGGGIVYYVSANNFTSTGSTCNTSCKYLEVAPATWQSAGLTVANDASYVWSNTNGLTGQDISTVSTEGVPAQSVNEKLNWKIGQGFYNTSVMKVSGATSAAQAAVLAYAGTSAAGQWFIPSVNELNELCKYARGQTTGDLKVACDTTGTLKTGTSNDLGGFLGQLYWSSSELASTHTWIYNFTGTGVGAITKISSAYIRPVRAF